MIKDQDTMTDGNTTNIDRGLTVTNHSTPNIPITETKLDGTSNYSSWKFMMKMTLIGIPLGLCRGGVVQQGKRDQRAMAVICLNVKACCHIYLQTATTAKEAWENLSKAYEIKGLGRKLRLLLF